MCETLFDNLNTYDAAGNLTWDGRQAYRYDAWNRLTSVAKAHRNLDTEELEIGSTLQENEYDGQGRRTVQRIVNSADWNATYHYYYEGQSVVELRNGSDLVLKQHVWAGSFGTGYIDELVATSLNSDPIADDEADVHHWALHNANFNLMGLVDENGVLVERYEYGPYGQRQVYFSPGPNDPLAMAPTSQSRRWQVGDVAQPYGLNAIGHQGLVHDEVSGLIWNGRRVRHPRLGIFIQRDPLGQNMPGGGYHDGTNLYQMLRGNPINYLDPFGTKVYVIERQLALADAEAVNRGLRVLRELADWLQESGHDPSGNLRNIHGLVEFYRNNTWHSIVVVADECDVIENEAGEVVGFTVDPNDTWDFQADNQVHNPADDFEEFSQGRFPSGYYGRYRVRELVSDNSMDDAVRNAANALAPSHRYKVGGTWSYNCSDWAAEALGNAGVQYQNPNPHPFGPQNHLYLWLWRQDESGRQFIDVYLPRALDLAYEAGNWVDRFRGWHEQK